MNQIYGTRKDSFRSGGFRIDGQQSSTTNSSHVLEPPVWSSPQDNSYRVLPANAYSSDSAVVNQTQGSSCKSEWSSEWPTIHNSTTFVRADGSNLQTSPDTFSGNTIPLQATDGGNAICSSGLKTLEMANCLNNLNMPKFTTGEYRRELFQPAGPIRTDPNSRIYESLGRRIAQINNFDDEIMSCTAASSPPQSRPLARLNEAGMQTESISLKRTDHMNLDTPRMTTTDSRNRKSKNREKKSARSKNNSDNSRKHRRSCSSIESISSSSVVNQTLDSPPDDDHGSNDGSLRQHHCRNYQPSQNPPVIKSVMNLCMHPPLRHGQDCRQESSSYRTPRLADAEKRFSSNSSSLDSKDQILMNYRKEERQRRNDSFSLNDNNINDSQQTSDEPCSKNSVKRKKYYLDRQDSRNGYHQDHRSREYRDDPWGVVPVTDVADNNSIDISNSHFQRCRQRSQGKRKTTPDDRQTDLQSLKHRHHHPRSSRSFNHHKSSSISPKYELSRDLQKTNREKQYDDSSNDLGELRIMLLTTLRMVNDIQMKTERSERRKETNSIATKIRTRSNNKTRSRHESSLRSKSVDARSSQKSNRQNNSFDRSIDEGMISPFVCEYPVAPSEDESIISSEFENNKIDKNRKRKYLRDDEYGRRRRRDWSRHSCRKSRMVSDCRSGNDNRSIKPHAKMHASKSLSAELKRQGSKRKTRHERRRERKDFISESGNKLTSSHSRKTETKRMKNRRHKYILGRSWPKMRHDVIHNIKNYNNSRWDDQSTDCENTEVNILRYPKDKMEKNKKSKEFCAHCR